MNESVQHRNSSEAKRPNIWIIEIGETVPLPGEVGRTMRAGQIARMLVKRGVNVTWWVSTYSHSRKSYIADPGARHLTPEGIELRFLHGNPYSRNISTARLANHWQVAEDFETRSRNLPPPDAIYCCYPTIDLAHAATAYGARNNVPVTLDIRDMWPDVFVTATGIPEWLGTALIAPFRARAAAAMKRATRIIATSRDFVEMGAKLAGRSPMPDEREVVLAYDKPNIDAGHLAQAESRWRERGLRLDGSEKIVCMFASISATPLIELAIAALNKLSDRSKQNFKMVICGTGTRYDWLKQQADLHPQLLAPGMVGGDDIFALMRHARAGLLLYPRRKDLQSAYPNKLGEYLAGGLPVISTVDGRVGDLLTGENCGLVVSDTDPNELARALDTMMVSDHRHGEMANNATSVFTQRFSAETIYGAFCDELIRAANPNQAKLSLALSA